jgi:hypothetical protein
MIARFRAGDGEPGAPCPAGEAVGGARHLEGHHRPPFRHPQDVTAMAALRQVLQDSDSDLDSGGAQQSVAEAGDLRVGIGHGRDDAPDAGEQRALDTRRAAADGAMRAGL